MGQWVGVQGRPKVAYFSKTCPFATSPPETPHRKLFFSILATRLAESAEGLNSSLAQSPGEVKDCKILQEKWRTRDLKGSNNYFKFITDVHSYNTRQVKTRQFALPKARSKSGAKMIQYTI